MLWKCAKYGLSIGAPALSTSVSSIAAVAAAEYSEQAKAVALTARAIASVSSAMFGRL